MEHNGSPKKKASAPFTIFEDDKTSEGFQVSDSRVIFDADKESVLILWSSTSFSVAQAACL